MSSVSKPESPFVEFFGRFYPVYSGICKYLSDFTRPETRSKMSVHSIVFRKISTFQTPSLSDSLKPLQGVEQSSSYS